MTDHREYMPPTTTADIAARLPHEAREMHEVPVNGHDEQAHVALFPQDELNRLRTQWTDIQAEFVDEPRRSVEEADGLVASTIQRLAESFAEARAKLESQWARGGDVSTEDLRIALRHYRSFFDRLLTI